MNDWLAGRRDATNAMKPTIHNHTASSSSCAINLGQNGTSSSYASNLRFQSETGTITHSTHRVGVLASSNNSVSSAILRGESVPDMGKKTNDALTFNNQGSVARLKVQSAAKTQESLKERPSPELPPAHANNSHNMSKFTSNVNVMQKNTTQNISNKFTLGASKRVIKRERAIENPSESSGVELQDWLEEQMSEYQTDMELAQTASTKRVKSCLDSQKDMQFSVVDDEVHASPFFLEGDHALMEISTLENCPKISCGEVEAGEEDLPINSMIQPSHCSQMINCESENFSNPTSLVSDCTIPIPTASLLHENASEYDSISSMASGLSEHRKASMTQYVSRISTESVLHFEKDGRIFSRFPFFRNTTKLQTTNATWPKHMFLNSLNLRRILFYDNVAVQVREGCTCIRFDTAGALFAVGSSNGVVRIFDFDECLAGMHGPTKLSSEESIPAIVGLPLGAAVTDIRWSLVNENELAVSFENSAEVHIYDIDLCQHNRDPLRVLRMVRGKSQDAIAASHRLGGNRVLCYMVPPMSGSGERIVAGGTLGHIRLWDIPNFGSDGAVALAPLWEISPQQTSQKCLAVVGLVPMGAKLLAFSACGSVTIWDVNNLRDGFFGKSPSPTLLQRVTLNMEAKLSGVSVSATENALSAAGGRMYGTLSTGSVKTIHVWCKEANERKQSEELWNIECEESSPHARTRPLRNKLLIPEEEVSATARGDVFEAPPCALLSYSDRDFVVSSFPQNLEPQNCLRIWGAADGHFVPPKVPPTKLCKSENICFTLPASIVRAVPGENKITVSDDLRQYLCGALMSSSLPGKSHQLLLAWAGPGAGTAFTSKLYHLDGIESRTLFLQEPYSGPKHAVGLKFCLRTNLAPLATQGEHIIAGRTQQDLFYHEIQVNAGTSALESHPKLPYVVIGTRTDEVHIVSALKDSTAVSFVPAKAEKVELRTSVPEDERFASMRTSTVPTVVAISTSCVPTFLGGSTASVKGLITTNALSGRSNDIKRPILRTVHLGVALNGLRQVSNLSQNGTEANARKMSSLERKSKIHSVSTNESFL